MENFIAFNPTTLHFGKGVIDRLDSTISGYGKRVLLVYGQGSVKRSGLYDKIKQLLDSSGMIVTEFGNIKPNPRVEDVDAAVLLGRQHEVDVILAVGGGSVIDSAKVISITIPGKHKAWDYYERKAKPDKAVPLIAILTLAATGTEMNPFAVLQNEEKGRKDGYGHNLMFPVHSFLDPEVTYSVPADYTAYGIADLIAHCLENYFGKGDCSLTDRLIFAILQDAIEWGPKLMNNLNGYEERAAIMYDATMALNLMTQYGKAGGDWGVHALGHILSLLHDVPHGATLSIFFPAWMKHHSQLAKDRIEKLGKHVFGTTGAKETIACFEAFFTRIGSPVRLYQCGIQPIHHDALVNRMINNDAQGNNFKMNESDYREIVRLASVEYVPTYPVLDK